MQNQIEIILNDMSDYLNINQMKVLQETLVKRLEFEKNDHEKIGNNEYLSMFLSAKEIEGCSERTLSYYETTIEKLLNIIDIPGEKLLR